MSVSHRFPASVLQKELLEIANEQLALTDQNISRRNELIQSG